MDDFESQHESKVIDLASRIKDAGQKTQTLPNEKIEESSDDVEKISRRAGSEFLGSVAGGGILGYATDWFFGTLPWGLMFFLIMGFISAVYRANAALQQEK